MQGLQRVRENNINNDRNPKCLKSQCSLLELLYSCDKTITIEKKKFALSRGIKVHAVYEKRGGDFIIKT